MITGILTERTVHQYKFELPLDAREIFDALSRVEDALGDAPYSDDRFKVISDGERLIFEWGTDG